MRIIYALVIATALIASPAFAQTMTPQQYHKDKGPCACPDDTDKAGHKCGKRSALCRPGGAVITGCYKVDIEKRTKAACG